MLGLVVRNPFARLIASGVKTLEIRNRRTPVGPRVICVAQEDVNGNRDPAGGTMLCVVDVVACRAMAPQDAAAACVPFADGAIAWELANPRPVRRRRLKDIAVRANITPFVVPDREIVLTFETVDHVTWKVA